MTDDDFDAMRGIVIAVCIGLVLWAAILLGVCVL